MKFARSLNKHVAIAFALGLAGAIAACSGDDDVVTGRGGSGGTAATDAGDARGGGGVATDARSDGAGDTSADSPSSAAPDVSFDGSGGAGGSDGGVDVASEGPSLVDDAGLPESGPISPSDGGADVVAVPDANDSSAAQPSPDVTEATDDAGETGASVDSAPGSRDASTTALFTFDYPDPTGTQYGWRSDSIPPALAVVADGSDESPGGSLEYTATFPVDTAQLSVFIQYGENDQTGGRADLADVTRVEFSVRLRNPTAPAIAGLESIQGFVVGGVVSQSATSSGTFIDRGSDDQGFFVGSWVTVGIDVGATGIDSGVRNIADLWRIALSLNRAATDAGTPIGPIVVDIDNVILIR